MEQIKSSLHINGFLESRIGGRSENQDYLTYSDTPFGFLVTVCDGMGGGPAGRVASENAAEEIVARVCSFDTNEENIPYDHILEFAIQSANLRLRQLQSQKTAYQGMGTTTTVLLINEKCAAVAHVGDSRIYQLRFGGKQFRTTDHSFVMGLVNSGELTEEQARVHPNSNVITRALGVSDTVQVETKILPFESGDRFVLCTDGVWGAMPEKKLIQLIGKTKDLAGTLEKIMITVDDIGHAEGAHHDNFSIALIETKFNSQYKEEMTRKTRTTLRILMCVAILSLLINIILASIVIFGNQSDEKLKQDFNELKSNYEEVLKHNEDLKSQLEYQQQAERKKLEVLKDAVSIEAVKAFVNEQEISRERASIIKQLVHEAIEIAEINANCNMTELGKQQVDTLKNLIVKIKTEILVYKPELVSSIQQGILSPLDAPLSIKDGKSTTRKSHYDTIKKRLTELIDKL